MFFHQNVKITAWLWSSYAIYWLLTLIPAELPSREVGVGDVFQDLVTLSMVGTGGLLVGFDTLINRKKNEGSTEVVITHYVSIVVAGYLSLIHPLVPVLVSTSIAVFTSLFLYYRGAFGSDITTTGFLVCMPVCLFAFMLFTGWPMYRVVWVASLTLWPNDISMPVEIDGCRAALMATLVQGVAAYGAQGI